MRPPGDLDELGAAGAEAWRQRVTELFTRAAESAGEGENRFIRERLEDPEAGITTTDWSGFPVRIADCLTRERALRLLDIPGETVDGGGRRLQEEYVEWRAVKRDGIVKRVELTTELRDYWRVLAGYAPERVLDLVSEFSGDTVSVADVYGSADALDRADSPREREELFVRAMLGPDGRSPYNDGRRAICCMVQASNDLASLLRLAVAATECRVVRDAVGERFRCLTCIEAASFVADVAQLGRGSDPVLVERFGRLAYEGRRVALDDPVGVYVIGVEHARLRTPYGDGVPAEWFTLTRGTGPEDAADGQSRYQRVVLQVPPGEGFTVGQLVDVATEQPIGHGGQVADLVILGVRVRVTERDVVDVDRESPIIVGDPQADPEACAAVRNYERRVLAAADAG